MIYSVESVYITRVLLLDITKANPVMAKNVKIENFYKYPIVGRKKFLNILYVNIVLNTFYVKM